jgi:hypothetical protein
MAPGGKLARLSRDGKGLALPQRFTKGEGVKLPVDGGDWEVPVDYMDAWKTVRPDAEEQFALMRIWLEANKSKRPVRPTRFVDNWMKKAPIRKPASVSRDVRGSVMRAIFGSPKQEVIDVTPAARRLG